MNRTGFYLIMLAAGFSRRFGSNKLLYEIDGQPMYRHTFEKLKQVKNRSDVEDVVVVSQYDEIEKEAACYGFHAAHNANSALGISSSLKVGLTKALELQLHTEPREDDVNAKTAFMFLVGDQPNLKVETIETMMEQYKSGTILCLFADGKRGNPVIFGEEFTEDLLALTGDTGGKQVMKKHPDKVVLLEVDPLELVDVDERKG